MFEDDLVPFSERDSLLISMSGLLTAAMLRVESERVEDSESDEEEEEEPETGLGEGSELLRGGKDSDKSKLDVSNDWKKSATLVFGDIGLGSDCSDVTPLAEIEAEGVFRDATGTEEALSL